MNEADLRSKGFVQVAGGVWAKTGDGGPFDIPDRDTRTAAKLESTSSDGTLETAQVQNGPYRRVHIRVTSFRRRLLDEDNLAEKFHVDCLRYAGAVSGDSPGQATIEVRQEKVGAKDPEFVRIEVLT